MVIVELIGSISLAIALIGAVAFTIIQIKNRQYDITYIRDHTGQVEINRSSAVLPFEEHK
jgi:hypothetical protein